MTMQLRSKVKALKKYSNLNGQFNSTKKDPIDSKTHRSFPNSVFFDTYVLSPVLQKFACKMDGLSLKHKDSFGKSENLSKTFYVEILVFHPDYKCKLSSSNGQL